MIGLGPTSAYSRKLSILIHTRPITCGFGIVERGPGFGSTLQDIINAINMDRSWSNRIPFPAICAPFSRREYRLYCNETILLQECWLTTCSTGRVLDTSSWWPVNFIVCNSNFIAKSTLERIIRRNTIGNILFDDEIDVVESSVLLKSVGNLLSEDRDEKSRSRIHLHWMYFNLSWCMKTRIRN